MHNGIPFENPWSLDSGQGIIVQQWLHDVWLYGWYSLAGYTGVATSVVFPLAIATIAYYFLIERLTRGCRHQGITWLLYAVGFFQMFTYHLDTAYPVVCRLPVRDVEYPLCMARGR